MKKMRNFLVGTIMIASGTVSAQNAHESSVKFNKNNQNAVVADYNQPSDAVEATLKKKFADEGLTKMKSSKGFMIFSGVQWNNVSPDKIDVYFKVEGKKDKSSVTVLLSKGYDNFISSGSDSRAINNVKEFLNGLSQETAGYLHALNIKQQEEAIAKAEKAFKNVSDDNKDLLAQKEKLEKRIADSNNEAMVKQKALDDERQKLEALKVSMN